MQSKTLTLFAVITLFATLGIEPQTPAQKTQDPIITLDAASNALTIPLSINLSGVTPINASQTDPKAQAKILDQYGKFPLSFEANHGQTDTRVKFLSRTIGYTLFLTGDEAVLRLRGSKTKIGKASSGEGKLRSGMVAPMLGPTTGPTIEPTTGGVLRMKLLHANPAAKVTGTDELTGTSNYFIGTDPTKWCSNVPTYSKVKYEGIYLGIDLIYYGNQRQLEYDFVVAPGADPSRIRLKFRGAGTLRIDDKGDLLLGADGHEVRLQKPQVYQNWYGRFK